jgi:phage tail-like protein
MADRANPYAAFNFTIELVKGTGGTPAGVDLDIKKTGFMECSGLDNEHSPIEYREGSGDRGNGDKASGGNFVHKYVGLERYPQVTLRRGITTDQSLWTWRKLVRDNPADRSKYVCNVKISLLDENHQSTKIAWILQDAWPCKLAGPSLNAKGNEIAVETLELCCERIEIDTGTSTSTTI